MRTRALRLAVVLALPGSLRGALCASVVLGSAVLSSCGSTPTLPLPPPVIAALMAPDVNGMVTVQGQGEVDAYVTVLNQDSEEGKITHVQDDGQFLVQVAAAVGDTLVIWQETAGVQGERTERTVPASSTQ